VRHELERSLALRYLIVKMGLGVQDRMNWIFHWDPELYTGAHDFERPVLSVSVAHLSTLARSHRSEQDEIPVYFKLESDLA
jgi:hypothetical protein